MQIAVGKGGGIFDHGGCGDRHGKGVHKLGHQVGLDDKDKIFFGGVGFIKMDLVGKGQKDVSRMQHRLYRVGVSNRFALQHIHKLQLAVQVGRHTERSSAVTVIVEGELLRLLRFGHRLPPFR
jgi:hypothetical protein